MTEYADLEVGLHRRDSDTYAVEFRFSLPNSEADVRMGQDRPAQAAIDLQELAQLTHDPAAYGQRLTQFLFAEPEVQAAFAQARASTQALGLALRLRLLIGPSAPELHSLHWETLRDPQDGSLLSTSENLLFTRYLSSLDWRPVRLRAKGQLQALIVIANPSNLADYDLAPVDVDGELSRARQSLDGTHITALPDPAAGEAVTLDNMVAQLRANKHDILYLVCHGALVRSEPWLWLEDGQGRVGRASGTQLVDRLRELEQRPRLVVLASCESAGQGTGSALAALGPRLAEAGVPAVLAMQGKISMDTVAGFMPVFFQELSKDGQIDRALAVARGAVRSQPDYWMPALFMRLKSGRIWYTPGFGEEAEEFEKWQSLAGFIMDKTCTPILGPGLADSILISRREIAMSWADQHGFPLAPQDRDVLRRVAQYVVTRQSPAYLPVAYRRSLQEGVLRRYQEVLPPDLLQVKSWSTTHLLKALDAVASHCSTIDSGHSFRVLAELRLPIYLTTGVEDFMKHALIEAGADPVVRMCPWNKWIPKAKVLYEDEPTPEQPLVYHLFGHVSVPNSLVLSEDSYLDYLIGITANESLIPSAVRAAMNNSSLMLLGFQMDDWEFRTLFRILLAQEGREMLKFYTHAAAQIEPEEDRIVDVKRARKYLEAYILTENISIFWGSTHEFLTGLEEHL